MTIDDGALVWREHPDPVPGDTGLLVEVAASGVNAADLIQRRGHYPAPPGVPADIPGLELAGTVVATGRHVTRFGVGDRVMAVVGGGAQAELAVVDETAAIEVPDTVDLEAAGGFPEAFSTAFDALHTQCAMALGSRVLVTGAAGGVGTAAVQLAAAAGASVVASTRHPHLHRPLTDLGAAIVVDPADAAAWGPFDVALELVGAASLPQVLGSLATGGRVAVIGVGSGAKVEVDLLQVMGRRVRISGSTLRARPLADKAKVAEAVAHHVVPLLASGTVQVPVAATFALADADAAYERFASGGKLGKVILTAR